MPEHPADPPIPLRLARLAMRTRFEVLITDDGDRAASQAAGEEALDEITQAEALLSAFQDGAELRRLNRSAGTASVPISPLMRQFLRRCATLVEATGGAFDPAIGALLDCWRTQDTDGGRAEPTSATISEALAAGDLRRQLVFDGEERHLRFAHPCARLDPGAVGKGWALDRAAARLRDAGVHNALLHGGTSTACALGDDPNHGGWTIAIRDPRAPEGLIAHARLSGSSLSISGQHGRTVAVGGRNIGHILDPRSGHPVDHTLLAAVIHPSALVSDALSTALLVLGVDGPSVLAPRFPEAQFLVLPRDGTRLMIGPDFR